MRFWEATRVIFFLQLQVSQFSHCEEVPGMIRARSTGANMLFYQSSGEDFCAVGLFWVAG